MSGDPRMRVPDLGAGRCSRCPAGGRLGSWREGTAARARVPGGGGGGRPSREDDQAYAEPGAVSPDQPVVVVAAAVMTSMRRPRRWYSERWAVAPLPR